MQKLVPMMKMIMDSMGTLLSGGHFDLVNAMLENYQVSKLDVPILLTILTITHSAKNKLDYYKQFYSNVAVELTNRGRDAKDLLKGLE